MDEFVCYRCGQKFDDPKKMECDDCKGYQDTSCECAHALGNYQNYLKLGEAVEQSERS